MRSENQHRPPVILHSKSLELCSGRLRQSELFLHLQHCISRSHPPRKSSPVALLKIPSPGQNQKELVRILVEIGEQMWHFPPERISRMLSPKKLRAEYAKPTARSPNPLHPLSRFDCLIDELDVQSIISEAISQMDFGLKTTGHEEETHYPVVVQFMNGCDTPFTARPSATLQVVLVLPGPFSPFVNAINGGSLISISGSTAGRRRRR